MTSKVRSVPEPAFGVVGKHVDSFVHPDDIRTAFALSMSHMYKNEVPLYGDLINIVQKVNSSVFTESPNSDSRERLALERHGAIRLGKPEEIRMVRRIFAVLGMQPVGYYDLSVTGLPMHATCFRPTTVESLARNPFRVFTTLLRPDLVRSEEARALALRMLGKRSIFSSELKQMLSTAETQDGLYPDQAEVFIREALKTFSWAPVASATAEEYQVLKEQHAILADIACFKTAHINHLTPRTLNISLAQKAMNEVGMAVKDRIEGPPARQCPILLRQTSFLALEESIEFQSGGSEPTKLIQGFHKARFGEIEERGAAVTPSGRKLYDDLLAEAMAKGTGQSPEKVDESLRLSFERFPDDWNHLRRQGLLYCEFQCTGKPIPDTVTHDAADSSSIIEKLLDEGVLKATPITYEDFLPFSAAGIFQSNLNGKAGPANLSLMEATPAQDQMEQALNTHIIDPDHLYASAQQRSLDSSLSKLRLSV